MNVIYDNKKSLASNVVKLFQFVNWLCREMIYGRVENARQDIMRSEQDILQTQADFVQSVEDEYNAICE